MLDNTITKIRGEYLPEFRARNYKTYTLAWLIGVRLNFCGKSDEVILIYCTIKSTLPAGFLLFTAILKGIYPTLYFLITKCRDCPHIVVVVLVVVVQVTLLKFMFHALLELYSEEAANACTILFLTNAETPVARPFNNKGKAILIIVINRIAAAQSPLCLRQPDFLFCVPNLPIVG